MLFISLYRPLPLLAEVVTDGSLGPAAALPGPAFQVPESLGRRVGNNLFHSFRSFSLDSGEFAIFNGSSSIENVISRVTGGEASVIDGGLRSEIGNASFYFINPAGVLFGQHAWVDVPGDFHVSTAQELRFADGGLFAAALSQGGSLSAASPESFGFLAPQSADIVINGSQLRFAPASTVGLSGGSLLLSRAALLAEGGELRLLAMGCAGGEAPVAGEWSAEGTGWLTVEQSELDSSGAGGGRIRLDGGESQISSSTLYADSSGAESGGGGIVIRADSLDIADSWISSDAYGTGASGMVRITTNGPLRIRDNAVVTSNTWSGGDSGGIAVSAGELILEGFGDAYYTGLFSRAESGADGAAGDIHIDVDGSLQILRGAQIAGVTESVGAAGNLTIHAGEVLLDGAGSPLFTGIAAKAAGYSLGNAGSITIETPGLLQVREGAAIVSSTAYGGDAGAITIAAHAMLLDGGQTEMFTGIASDSEPYSVGHPGSVTIIVDDVIRIVQGAQVSSSTVSLRDAGEVTLRARGIILDSQGSSTATGIGSISYEGGWGAAGTIDITAAEFLHIFNEAQITSSTWTMGSGGDVRIRAGEVLLDAMGSSLNYGAGISSTAESASQGDAGTVTLTVDGELRIANGAAITTSTWSAGNGGDIVVTSDSLVIEGHLEDYSSALFSAATASATGMVGTIWVDTKTLRLADQGMISIFGEQQQPASDDLFRPGSVVVRAGRLLLEGASAISAESTGLLPASSVEIAIDDYLLVSGESRITTEAAASDGGAVVMGGSGVVELRDGIITTSTRGGRGGDITVSPAILIMENGFIQANTDDGAQGGAIFVDVPYLVTPGSIPPLVGGNERHVFQAGSGENVIQAAAPGGEQGTITITSPQLDLGAGLSLSGARPLHPPQLAITPCDRLASEDASSLMLAPAWHDQPGEGMLPKP